MADRETDFTWERRLLLPVFLSVTIVTVEELLSERLRSSSSAEAEDPVVSRAPKAGPSAFVEDDEYDELMAKKAALPKTKFGDAYDPAHVDNLRKLMEARK